MSEIRCPKCGKLLTARAHEDNRQIVGKVRFLKYSVHGGPVKGKCRHCGYFATIPDLRVVNS